VQPPRAIDEGLEREPSVSVAAHERQEARARRSRNLEDRFVGESVFEEHVVGDDSGDIVSRVLLVEASNHVRDVDEDAGVVVEFSGKEFSEAGYVGCRRPTA
jgi:hypothetical protein